VATVNATSGLVTSVATGEVTIFVDAQGVRGSKRITVVKNYTGIWSGNYSVTACTQTGDFATINLCATLSVGSELPVAFNLTQTGSTVSGQTALGMLISQTFTTTAAPGGALSFQAQYVQDTLRVAQQWQLNVSAAGLLAGTVVQTWTETSLLGQAVVSGTMLTVTKVSGGDHAAELQPDTRIRSLADALMAVRRR
jgi:hypothetical protein